MDCTALSYSKETHFTYPECQLIGHHVPEISFLLVISFVIVATQYWNGNNGQPFYQFTISTLVHWTLATWLVLVPFIYLDILAIRYIIVWLGHYGARAADAGSAV